MRSAARSRGSRTRSSRPTRTSRASPSSESRRGAFRSPSACGASSRNAPAPRRTSVPSTSPSTATTFRCAAAALRFTRSRSCARPRSTSRSRARPSSSWTTCSTRGERFAPRSRRSSTTAVPSASSWRSLSTAAIASCRFAPITSARTSRLHATSASRCSSSRSTRSIASCSFRPQRRGATMADIRVMREDLRPPATPPRRHFISIKDITRDDIERLLATARTFERSLEREVKKLPTLKGRLVINVFYESSTRTSSSFELAAKRLSADTMSIKSSGSSVDKGESLKDTAITLGAYDPDVIVIRHPQIGAPQLVARVTEAHVVNAGDGKHQHPTQALLDLYTMREELGRIDGLHVAIVGDVLHSRVARSLIQALALMGAHVTLVAPPALLPRGIEAMGCETTTDIGAIAAADVVYVLRMQRERMQEGANYVPSLREYATRWGITPDRLRPGQKVMHPGPMNRGVEIDARVADHSDALIEMQVRAGLVTRMAVLYDLLTSGPVEVKTESVLEVA